MRVKILPNIIVNFHAIIDAQWIENMLILLSTIYNMVGAEDIFDFYYNGKKIKNSCHITFDDGEKSFYSIVFPLLKKYNIPASIFVSPKIIKEQSNFWFQEISDYDISYLKHIISKEKKFRKTYENTSIYSILKQMKLNDIWRVIDHYRFDTGTPIKPCKNMNLDQIIELHKSKLVHIGAHTLNHPILINEDDSEAHIEISTSIKELSNLLGTKVISFAYPNGNPKLDFGLREIDILKSCGVDMAFSTELKSMSFSDNPLSIPRSGFENGKLPYILIKLTLGKRWNYIKALLNIKSEDDFRLLNKKDLK
jgi:peptidoglycan/xylan/chitin deacetylase (PgdA/CDA1 family)